MTMYFSLLTLILPALAGPAATPVAVPLLPVLGTLFLLMPASATVSPM